MKLDRKQDLKVLYQVCVFRADWKNKMATLASDWLRHFRLLLWNRWTEFNKTWQEARSQCHLPCLCFSGRSQKQDGRPCLWLAETLLTSFRKLLKGIQRNLTGSKISKSSTRFVFLVPIGKTKCPPWPLIGWDIFDFSSETEFKETWQEARSQPRLPGFFFSGSFGKIRCLPRPLIGWDGGTKKFRNFDHLKPVPAGHLFSRKICFVPESLWPVKCTIFSGFWSGQLNDQGMYTISTWHLCNDVVKCIDSN